MKAAHIFLLFLLGAALLSTVLCNSASGPDDCCFELFRKRVSKKLISSYYKTDPRCPVSAAVLITMKMRRICVDPKQAWVERVIHFLEARSL